MEKSNVVSLHPIRKTSAEAPLLGVSANNIPESAEPPVSSAPGSVVQDSTIPAVLRSLRNRTSGTGAPGTSALSMLQKARQRPATTGTDQQGEGDAGGESLNLDVRVAQQGDGGLTVTTAGKKAPPDVSQETQQANRRLAQDEENILRHRHPHDPGYDENDQHYDDREPDL